MAERRIPELDGYRVVMIFLVSWFHIWQQSWLTPWVGHTSLDFLVRAGYMPVDATILLSGFLLYLPCVGNGAPKARDFYRRRIARVVPSYLFVTLLMLFAVAIPQARYRNTGALVTDLLTHLTFTFPFTEATYQHTPLGGASWTLAIEVHFYLLFPLLARLSGKHPAGTLLGMTALSAYFRGWCLWRMNSYSMVVNQLASFLDVYALGMACAILWPHLRKRRGTPWTATIATGVLILGVTAFVAILKDQARSGGYDAIQAGQMIRRPVFALACAAILLALPLSYRGIRLAFGNPVMRFLSGISLNYYLLHQNIAVWLREHDIPHSAFELPNQSGDLGWQLRYTWLCFGISLAAAAAVTYLIEKPLGVLIRGKKTPA